MNDQKIYQYLARKPDSRAQDIADAMDVELKVASDALRCLVDEGDVVRYAGIAKNGLPSQLYNLSEMFKRTSEGKALIAAAAGFVDVDPAPAPVTPRPEPAPVATPVFIEKPDMSGTRVSRAIACVEKHGTATEDQMRAAMGLVQGSYVGAYLASALKSGKLVKTSAGWTAGDGTPPKKRAFDQPITQPKPKHGPVAQFKPSDQPDDVKNVVVVGNTILASKDAKAIAPEVVAAVADVEPLSDDDRRKYAYETDVNPFEDEAPADAPATFRCGLWSDGVIELQRNGVQVASLTRGEGEHLADFMRRMLGQADKVAA